MTTGPPSAPAQKRNRVAGATTPATALMQDLYGRPLEPTPPRRLTLRELRDLTRAGFPELAKAIAAGACTDCGHSRASRFHREACEERLNPVLAPEQPRQPWEARPPRARAA